MRPPTDTELNEAAKRAATRLDWLLEPMSDLRQNLEWIIQQGATNIDQTASETLDKMLDLLTKRADEWRQAAPQHFVMVDEDILGLLAVLRNPGSSDAVE